MASIKLTPRTFKVIPEGNHIFRIDKVDYNADFGKMLIHLVTANGDTHIERFSFIGKDGNTNEKALNAFSFFAKTAINDFDREEIDPNELVNHYIGGKITHTVMPSNTDPTKNVTFANITEKWVAEGFDTVEAPQTETVASSLDLDNLLN